MSQNVILKNVDSDDIDFLYNLRNEYIEFQNSINGNEEELGYEKHREFVLEFLENKKKHPYEKWHIIILNEKKVGSIPLKKNGEFGYQVLKAFEGKKICQIGIEIFFKENNKKDLWAKAIPSNLKSNYLLKKWGFVKKDNRFVFNG